MYKQMFNLIKVIIFIFTVSFLNATETPIKPDNYSKEGYCIVKEQKQKELGLLRFKSKDEVNKYCNGKMYFLYDFDECRYFTMKNMKFDIYIEDKNGVYRFKINELKKVCGITIIETIK